MQTSSWDRWFSRGGMFSSCTAVLGSWQICHTVCMTLVAMLATVGIALQGMPLLFLNRFQWPLWIFALVLFGVVLILRFGFRLRCISSRGIVGNGGLLLAGVPVDGSLGHTLHIIGLCLVLFALLWWMKDCSVKRTGNTLVIDMMTHGVKILFGFIGLGLTLWIFSIML